MALYRALLRLYPKSFRHEYGEEMAAIFRDRWRRAGAASRVLIWFAVVPETLANAALVHWELLRQDLRYAFRWLRASPGFAVTAIVIIALGIGANTAVFSVADFMLIRPLPFHDPGRLVNVLETTPGYSGMELSPGNYRDWKRMNSVASAMATYTTFSLNLSGSGAPERLEVGLVSADLFSVLGVRPIIGHDFSASDDAAPAPGTLLLSYAYWRSHFNGDASVVGRALTLNDQPYTVLGVMPADFRFPDSSVALWVPQRFTEETYVDRTDNFLNGVARLRPGVTLAQAQADFVRVAAILEQQFPRENARTGAVVSWMRDDVSSQPRSLLLALGGAAACVLLIVCANLANLLIARAVGRRRELAVRAALGAGRERLVRQLVTESLVLAAAGGTLGVGMAVAGVPLLTALVPIDLPIAHAPSVDLRVLAFAAVLTIATGLVFGLIPVLRLGRVDVDGLREGARAGGGAKERLRGALVVAEVALSVVLLVSAGLLLRALWSVQRVDPGFRASGILTLRTDLPRPRYDATVTRVAFYDRVLSDVRALPGVTDAGYIGGLPLVRGGGIWPVTVKGQAIVRGGNDTASLRFITPGYLETMGIPILRGRDFDASDTADRQAAAIVSESFARRLWPDADPIGRTFTMAFAERIVVGVAGDVHVRTLERTSEPQVYASYMQVGDGNLIGYFPNDLAVRIARGDPAVIAPSVRDIIHRVDPEQPISDVRTIDEIVALKTESRGVQLRVIGSFAALALLLAAIGIHGLLSFTVSQRTQEIGVRLALGAAPRAILAMVTREAATLVFVGVVSGCALAYAAGRAMQALLAGISPADGWTFGVAIAAAVTFELAGSLLPARRASRVDPVSALRL
ncbi:MAG: ABC transporter permease [Vicinamibacterales bacterium]